ncbi:MAG: DUF1800 domain-containing protein [Acidimicrobiales bacterium]
MAGSDRLTIAHLLRRTGFGPTAAEVDAAAAKGYDAVVDGLLDPTVTDPADHSPAPTFAPNEPGGQRNLTPAQRQAINSQRGQELAALQAWWLDRMATTGRPLREKLTFFWHDHFATSYVKVRRADYLYRQNQIFRTMGMGPFEDLAQAVAKDPAMLLWLDAATDKKAHPNENFAREMMELFVLGIGNYTEDDVREAARAFTGWYVNPRTEAWAVVNAQHDDGVKTFLGQTGTWTGEQVIHIAVNAPPAAPFLVSRIWSHFAYPVAADDPVVNDLAPAFARDRDVAGLVRRMLLDERFVSPTARAGLVKQPVEWLIGALRALGLPATGPRLVGGLRQLGQVPFEPPNVGGWPQNEYWVTTASSLARLNLAAALANQADLSALTAVSPSGRIDAVAHLLSVAWSDETARGLGPAAANPKELVTLALVAPEFVLA